MSSVRRAVVFVVLILAAGAAAAAAPVTPSVEVLLKKHAELLAGRRIGLITNQTGVDSQLRSTADLLHADPRFRLVALFGPEHGIRGGAEAGEKVGDRRDPATGLPVYSLYSGSGRGRLPRRWRRSTCWSAISRTSAAVPTRMSGRWRSP